MIEGNFIGTDVTGTLPLGNGEYGVDISAHGNTIGGSAVGAGNVIASNADGGINTESADGLVIQGNFIGTDSTGTLNLGNHGPAIGFDGGNGAQVGGVNPGEGNTIAFNGIGSSSGAVVVIADAVGITIRGNSIHDNVAAGIDLGTIGAPDGITPNDLGDGGHRRQQPPELPDRLGGDATAPSSTTVGRASQLDGEHDVRPRLLRQPRVLPLPARLPPGRDLHRLGAGDDQRVRQRDLPRHDAGPVTSGSPISATATDPAGNTSEFSQRLPFSSHPAGRAVPAEESP